MKRPLPIESGLAIQWAPAQSIFDTVDLKPDDWLLVIAAASSVCCWLKDVNCSWGLHKENGWIPSPPAVQNTNEE